MPIIKSAKKRVRTAQKAAIRNSKVKRQLKEAIRAVQDAVLQKDSKKAAAALPKAQAAIDTAVKKRVIHKNKAARKKTQLVENVKSVGAKPKPATKASTAQKPAPSAKKPAKKAAATRKPAQKKSPATKKSK